VKSNSEVLARKYRPNSFDELIGQDTISQTLSLALDSNRLSHAYLFSGLRGSGKTSTARIFAKALVCDNGPTSRPCNTCNSCVMANEGRSMDIIEMDAASSRKIDDIRDLIEHTKYKPTSSRFKIFIIDEVHMLTKEAFNALLKTLEEPPDYVKFILATTDPLKLPATILSRTQHFRFKKISHQNVVNHLIHILQLENIEYQMEALDVLARSGSGSLRDTLTLLDQAIIYSKNFVDIQTVTDMLGLIDPKFIDAIFNSIFAKDNEKILLHVKELEDYESEMVVDELIAYLKDKMFEKDTRFSTLILDRYFRILSDSKSLFAINADGSFVISLLFMKMLEALKIKEIDQMIEALESQITRPAQVDITQRAEYINEAVISSVEPSIQTPLQEVATPITQSYEDPIVETSPVVEAAKIEDVIEIDPHFSDFVKLQVLIQDRNATLGDVFSRCITYISYAEDTLTWQSCALDADKEVLRHGFSAIKQLAREIFGFETAIKNRACPEDKLAQLHVNAEIEEQEERPAYMDEPSSMVEEAEVGVGSCVISPNSADDNSTKEFDSQTILDEPMIKKASELFEATKITVQTKI